MGLSDASWRKATRSGAGGGDCVEVADNLPGMVLVRDSKNRHGGMLTINPVRWQSFVELAKQIGPVG